MIEVALLREAGKLPLALAHCGLKLGRNAQLVSGVAKTCPLFLFGKPGLPFLSHQVGKPEFLHF
jgi:hypothetical protein